LCCWCCSGQSAELLSEFLVLWHSRTITFPQVRPHTSLIPQTAPNSYGRVVPGKAYGEVEVQIHDSWRLHQFELDILTALPRAKKPPVPIA
jgi:hypothetical protein